MRIAIVGDGGWGTANAILLAGYGHEVTVWSVSAAYADEVRNTHLNARYLPGVVIPGSIHWTGDEPGISIPVVSSLQELRAMI